MRRRWGWGDGVVLGGVALTALAGAGMAWTSWWPDPLAETQEVTERALTGAAGALLTTAALLLTGTAVIAIVRTRLWLLVGALGAVSFAAAALVVLRQADTAPPAEEPVGRLLLHGAEVTLFWGVPWPLITVVLLSLAGAFPVPRR